MRVKQPEPFDPNREYNPGERCVYRGMVLIAEIWTAADARLANSNPAIFTQRCVRCKIQREDCPGIGRQCDKYNRTDRKTIFWRLAYTKTVRTNKKIRMTESKLNPFDAELLVMIGDIAKSQPEVEENPDRYEITVDTTEIQGNAIEALKQAVAGRLGKRLLVTHTLDAAVVFNVEYDPTEYPEQIRTRLVEPDATAGTRYCRTLLEVDAIQVRRDNLDDLLRFTGGGTMTIPRTPNGRAVYSFPDGNGIFIDAPETYYIVREPDGRLTTRPEREFNREFEPKGVSVPKEPGDKGCGNCANFTNEDVNGNGYCEAFKCEQSCGVMPCQEYKPKNQ